MRPLTFMACSVLLLSLLLLISIVSSAPSYEHVALQAADQCDWIGSGGGGRGVRPVYLRCSRGTVLWRYPRGALRVVLSPPVLAGFVSKANYGMNHGKGNVNKKNDSYWNNNDDPFQLSGFRTCTKISGPVRVYLETHGKLRSIYSPRDGKDIASHRCFHAKKQPAALYIEAEEFTLGELHNARLQYDLEVRYVDIRQGVSQRFNDEEEDCRPCTMDELAKAYCQSDFIARGTVSAVQRRPNLEAAELVLRVTKILRRIEENESNNDADPTDSHDRKNVRVRVPTACDARHGQGEFVIMAKRRLGDLVLVCAPRIETWAKTVRELETAPCVLQS
ncbi:meteorin-like protein [Bombus vosnesenskii]|uniref:Meteorin-like protein n=2 Tax=Pyrobombus TaxID=144703 RepID=A0A6J3LMZ5_9HYME|nr:meteorin-like protein [Bombus vancouverensis nearcticus]XP_033308361.1 meteorin-like protein [Bombus bifarius]XP_033366081.1 meteorin-like protein [Bombus vosnesenskii]XP_050489882.1 meteorin-like protein [Bombus huntii]